MQYVINYVDKNGRLRMEQFDTYQLALDYEDQMKLSTAVIYPIRKVTETIDNFYHVIWATRNGKKGYKFFHDEKKARDFYEMKKTKVPVISLEQETMAATRTRWSIA